MKRAPAMNAKDNTAAGNARDPVLAILQDRRPDRIPFVDRLELWYESRRYTGTLPGGYAGMTLDQVHQAVGMGRFAFVNPYALKLHGVELVCRHGERVLRHESDPEIVGFPTDFGAGLVPRHQAGTTVAELTTPAGRLHIRWEMAESMIGTGVLPYVKEHPIKEETDFLTVQYILERAEFVSRFDEVYAAQAEMGGGGFAVPGIHRIPFQHLLLEYMGEVPLFYALHDSPERVDHLLDVLDELQLEILDKLAGLDVPYIEYTDNLDGHMTNPRLFQRFCLPAYQRYTEILHGQGKKVGSHTDGELKPLLGLLSESGLDICESFSPAPLTRCTFQEAWQAWQDGPVIWGGIPSTILEESTAEGVFREHVHRLLETIAGRPIILGIGDQVLHNSRIERIQYIAEQVEQRAI
jgi:uroporphyrinogen-III decarboxylase